MFCKGTMLFCSSDVEYIENNFGYRVTIKFMWRFNKSVRSMRVCLVGFILMISLSGCREIASNPAEYERYLIRYGSWDVRASWAWENSGERVMTIRGLGTWRNNGKVYRLKEQIDSTSITTSNENGYLVLEDGTKYPINSILARSRVERSMFNALDPLKIAAWHGVALRVEKDFLVGEGPCRNNKPGCRISIELKVDSALRPVHARSSMQIGDKSEIVEWYYGKDLSIAW